MDIFYPATMVGLTTLASASTYLVRRVIDTDKTLAAHISENDVMFAAHADQAAASSKVADERHGDLKDRLVRIETKLDKMNGGSHA